jgi:hypothetical protein
MVGLLTHHLSLLVRTVVSPISPQDYLVTIPTTDHVGGNSRWIQRLRVVLVASQLSSLVNLLVAIEEAY